MMLEDSHERVMSLTKTLFQFFSKTNIVKPDQIKNVSLQRSIFVSHNYTQQLVSPAPGKVRPHIEVYITYSLVQQQQNLYLSCKFLLHYRVHYSSKEPVGVGGEAELEFPE